jgi:hypothetical protein
LLHCAAMDVLGNSDEAAASVSVPRSLSLSLLPSLYEHVVRGKEAGGGGGISLALKSSVPAVAADAQLHNLKDRLVAFTYEEITIK